MPRRTKDELRADYLAWLEAQLRDEHSRSNKTYWELLNVMFEKVFPPPSDIPMDHNRLVDGLDLRVEFANNQRLNPAKMQFLGECSFLEVLLGLSRRLSFVAGGSAPGWAWQLLNNLEMHRLSDPLTRPKHRKALEIMDTVIERTYLPDGTGGFFPLAWPDTDMTREELWYQLNAYVSELHPEH